MTKNTLLSAIFLQLAICTYAAEPLPREDLKPLLSPVVYAAAGVPATIQFENTVLCEDMGVYKSGLTEEHKKVLEKHPKSVILL